MIEVHGEPFTGRRVGIAVYGRDGQLQLVVEVKNRMAATAEWAMHMRRNLVAHLDIPGAPFFLLALPDHFYLWHNVTDSLDIVPAAYDIDLSAFLAPYIGEAYRVSDALSENGLKLAVSAWLSDLIAADPRPETALPEQRWLFNSGLYPAIKGGSLASDVAV